MHVDYAIPVSVYFKEGRVGVLETKCTRQHTSLPCLLAITTTPLQGQTETPPLLASWP